MRVLIITGGNSSERTVSLNSAKNVKKALTENGHKVALYDLRKGYGEIKKISRDFDILFPVLHGEEGEGGKLHKFLSTIKKPIVGTRNYKGLQKGWYKIPFKKYCDKNNIKTSKWKIVKGKSDILNFGFPCVLKASNGGSSKEVVVLKSEQDFHTSEFDKLINSNAPLFVEKYLTGTEVTVGILNGIILPLIEIIPPKGQWFSYKNKYTSKTQEIPFAPSIDNQTQEELRKVTLKVTKMCNLGSYLRIDFMVHDGAGYALDVNTIPGLTAASLMPKQAKAAGLSFNEFLEILLKTAK